jgi:uncharacterized protein (DUF3820 family)
MDKKNLPNNIILQDDFDQTLMPFGKYQGIPVDGVDLEYIDYIIGQWESDGDYCPHPKHDTFMLNLRAYMKQDWVQREFEKEVEED